MRVKSWMASWQWQNKLVQQTWDSGKQCLGFLNDVHSVEPLLIQYNTSYPVFFDEEITFFTRDLAYGRVCMRHPLPISSFK